MQVVQSHALSSEDVVTLSHAQVVPSVAEIYEEYFSFVWRVLGRFGVPPQRLEDAAHDVFLIVHRRIAEFEHRSSVKTWLYGISLRVAKVHREQARRLPSGQSSEALAALGPEDDPHEATARAQARALVRQVLDDMDYERRVIFVLVELEQVAVPQVAESLGIPLNTVYSRLRLARRDFDSGIKRVRARDGWRLR